MFDILNTLKSADGNWPTIVVCQGEIGPVGTGRILFDKHPCLRPIPIRPIWSPPTAIVCQLESADWVGVEILNIFDMESRPTIVKSVVESADSGIESADSTADSTTNPLRIGLWVRALRQLKC